MRDPILIVSVGSDREAPTDTRQIGQFVFAKPAGPIGDKGQHVSGGISAIDRHGDIVGAAALAQLDQHLKIKLVVRQVEAPPQCFSAIADAIHRVLLIGDRVADLVRDHHLHGLSRISPPGDRGAEELRMQRGGVERYPYERHSGGDQAPGEFVEAGNALGELAPLEQPVGDIVDRVVNRTPFGRTRHPPDDANVLGQKRTRSRLSRCVARLFQESAGHRTKLGPVSGRAQATGKSCAGPIFAERHPINTVELPCPRGRLALGHEGAFPPPRLSARCRFSQGTFAGRRGNGRGAPKPAVRLSRVERGEPTHYDLRRPLARAGQGRADVPFLAPLLGTHRPRRGVYSGVSFVFSTARRR